MLYRSSFQSINRLRTPIEVRAPSGAPVVGTPSPPIITYPYISLNIIYLNGELPWL